MKYKTVYTYWKAKTAMNISFSLVTDCGGIIDLSAGQQQIIKSPNYPNTYSVDKECVWMIRVWI